jgi:hypothetical protein
VDAPSPPKAVGIWHAHQPFRAHGLDGFRREASVAVDAVGMTCGDGRHAARARRQLNVRGVGVDVHHAAC